jgi:hypothetical protein
MSKVATRKKSRTKAKSQTAPAAFLVKTYDILENPEYHDIACWNKEGNAFIVKNVNEFSDKVLPKYFKHNNFASFVRQLNMYDFHKSRQEGNENEFSHSAFKRGHKDLLSDIKRKIADPQPPTGQLVPVSKEIDFDRFKKEAMQFSNDLKSLKTRQSDLEKITKVIFTQNTKLLSENKLLWKELIKNKEKYERKIEKLMLFIFSIMQYSNGGGPKSLGPSETARSLAAGALNGYGDSDQEQGKMSLDPDQLPQIPLQSLQDKNDHEKFLKKVSQYFQNKENKSNLDKLIDMAQKGKLPNFSSSQDDLLEAGLDLDGINYVENLKRQSQYPPNMSNIPLASKYTRRTSSNNRKYPSQSINNLDMFNSDPTKFMKVDPSQNQYGSDRMPAPMQSNNNDVSSMFMQMPPETQFTPQMSMTTNTGQEGTDFFPPPGQYERMQSFNFDNPNKDLQQQQQQSENMQNQFYNPSMPAFDYSPKAGFGMPSDIPSEIKDPFGLQRNDSDMFLAKDDAFNKDPFDFSRLNSNPPDNMNYYNPDQFIQPNNGFQFDQQIDENFDQQRRE